MKEKIKKIIFIISFIPYVILIFNIIRYYIFGYSFSMWGLDILLCYGFRAVYNYLWVTFSISCFGIFTIPLFVICIIYQIIYYKKLKKKKLVNNK